MNRSIVVRYYHDGPVFCFLHFLTFFNLLATVEYTATPPKNSTTSKNKQNQDEPPNEVNSWKTTAPKNKDEGKPQADSKPSESSQSDKPKENSNANKRKEDSEGTEGTGNGGKIISSVDDLSDVAKSKITTSQRATLNQQERTYSHLTEMDLKGAQRDLDGDPVPKLGGGYYDHAQEVSDAYRGLVDLKRSWEGMLKNPNLDAELRQLYTSKLNEVNATMQKIETMFDPHGGVFPPK